MLFVIGYNHLAISTTDQHGNVVLKIFNEQTEFDAVWPKINTKTAETNENPGQKDNKIDQQNNEIKFKNQMINERITLLCGAFFQDKLLAVCDDQKRLLVWRVDDTGSDQASYQWKLNREFIVDRKLIKLIFSSCDHILGGDKSGDVHQFDLSSGSQKLLMGHCSMLLDMVFSSNGQNGQSNQYLITCDRDEKIRVSRYPNSYHIESYCLGHTEFVSSIVLIDDQTLVSGSGDGTLRFWQFVNGKQFKVHSCHDDLRINQNQNNKIEQQEKAVNESQEKLNDKLAIKSIDYSNGFLSVIFYNSTKLLIYHLNHDNILDQIKLIDCMSFDDELLHAKFDIKHPDSLWVLVKSTKSPFKIYDVSFEKIQENKSIYINIINSLTSNNSLINENDLFQVELLYKQSFNNIETYYQKKEERIKSKIK